MPCDLRNGDISNRRVHYTASLHLRVELRREKKHNKPCAFRKTSHAALYVRVGICNGCAFGREYLFQRISFDYLYCIKLAYPAHFNIPVLQMQIRNEPLSSIVTRQRRIRQRICEEKCRFVASPNAAANATLIRQFQPFSSSAFSHFHNSAP